MRFHDWAGRYEGCDTSQWAYFLFFYNHIPPHMTCSATAGAPRFGPGQAKEKQCITYVHSGDIPPSAGECTGPGCPPNTTCISCTRRQPSKREEFLWPTLYNSHTMTSCAAAQPPQGGTAQRIAAPTYAAHANAARPPVFAGFVGANNPARFFSWILLSSRGGVTPSAIFTIKMMWYKAMCRDLS